MSLFLWGLSCHAMRLPGLIATNPAPGGRALARGALFAVAVLVTAAPARAQLIDRTLGNITNSIQNVLDLRPSDTTDWRLGLGPYISPAFEGSREYKIRPAPLISVRYRDV